MYIESFMMKRWQSKLFLIHSLLAASVEIDHVSAFNSQPLRKPNSRRGHEVAYVGTISPVDVYSSERKTPERKINGSDETTTKHRKRSKSIITSGGSLHQPRRISRPKSLTNRPKIEATTTNSPKIEATTTFSRTTENTPALLTKDEERDLTNQIRMLRTVIRIRDELVASQHAQDADWQATAWQPTEEQWADACGMAVIELRKVMLEGQAARSLMVGANGGLVGSIAKRYLNSVTKANQANGGMGTIISFHDLVQEGNLGLMEAAEKFEPERGFRFSTYATWWVRARMLRAISDYSRTIRLPAHGESNCL